MATIARTPEEIDDVVTRLVAIAAAASEAGYPNVRAEAMIHFGQWVLGTTDIDPTNWLPG